MSTDSRRITVARGDERVDATIAWRRDGWRYAVTISSDAFATVEEVADDAFEALSLVREHLEPAGWRIGVVGAQADVWPSGMARDQGGGLRAYRLTETQVGDLVDVFEPADPASATTVAAQRAESDRLYDLIRTANRRG
ncbi:hypothetical protein KZX37_10975 [Microbacterium sp. EYE_5]|uniref:hypothetical protein n=1 Tax=unclassified Microbacterium TaxID=2609290 RepID=UPI00200482CE|nr:MULTISPECIES: hypothetical protein [unclassified Microbacterium]MCK6080964.1 hypothetical protein [Microbacterium sp. EYE_382]MCK6086234.1 hypothetical protein [Microbacterium sp. EYE_384]MCK6124268.1 hypothetical protein [Microbacterium sp. EYE_80]MCK6127177.1 hypothetical protein [Microbacterium sp. EYE_79]MCK6141919.1 hypothetical protein [Microbacterium sp. EYE_39]